MQLKLQSCGEWLSRRLLPDSQLRQRRPSAILRLPRNTGDAHACRGRTQCLLAPTVVDKGGHMKRRRFILGGGLIAASPFMAAAQGGQASGQEAGQSGRRGGGGMTRGPIGGRNEGLQPLDGGKIGNMPAMKITDIKTFLVGAGGRNWIYVKVLTD